MGDLLIALLGGLAFYYVVLFLIGLTTEEANFYLVINGVSFLPTKRWQKNLIFPIFFTVTLAPFLLVVLILTSPCWIAMLFIL